MDGIIAINGKTYPPEEASISVLDRGFLFGDNIFEVLVAFGNKILDVREHLHRLRQSADLLGLNIPWSDEELTFEMTHLVEQLHAPKSYLRLILTRGNGLGLEVSPDSQPNKVILAFPAKVLADHYYQKGLSLKSNSQGSTKRGPTAKTGNYLSSILALQEAQKQGFDDIIWNNAEGEVTEAATANIFFIGRQGNTVEIVTPSVQSGLLRGITRSRILQLLQEAKIPAEEQIIYHEELPRFDEAFLCSTVKGLLPIRQINDHQLHTLRPNSIFQHIQRLFMASVQQQLGFKVNWNTGKRKT